MLAVNVKTPYQQLIYEATHVSAEQRISGSNIPSDRYDTVIVHLANGEKEEFKVADIFVMCEGKTVASYHLHPTNEETTGPIGGSVIGFDGQGRRIA